MSIVGDDDKEETQAGISRKPWWLFDIPAWV